MEISALSLTAVPILFDIPVSVLFSKSFTYTPDFPALIDANSFRAASIDFFTCGTSLPLCSNDGLSLALARTSDFISLPSLDIIC